MLHVPAPVDSPVTEDTPVLVLHRRYKQPDTITNKGLLQVRGPYSCQVRLSAA
jgi:hypothetical protein